MDSLPECITVYYSYVEFCLLIGFLSAFFNGLLILADSSLGLDELDV
jgi:hypothetical protein